MRILIANRGEIARRIIRTAHRLGHQTVAAYADPDRDAPFVAEASSTTRLGPAELSRSYLSIDALIEAGRRTGADAVHPGYGFLAERADFARAVQREGWTWIGPHPDAIERMGSKIEARRLATLAGVPVIPGFDASQDPGDLAAAAERIGYPVLVKASAGGGGKGIRVVHDPRDFATGLADAGTEAERTFGDASVIVERFVLRPRHIEVQVVGDQHGRVIDLGTRECSLQRRYQKVVEEAPAPGLEPCVEQGLRTSAVELARAIGYDSAGTVEFIVDADTGDHFFLEMNTRLQVEHPVTELVTGLDLVELQLAVAEGGPLPVSEDGVVLRGHAFEARVNAEDPWAGFIPQTGVVEALRLPEDVRWDAGVEVGSAVTPHYDPMIAKLIVAGPDRETARRRLVEALDHLLLAGVPTNGGFLRWLMTRPEVVDGRATTRFIDEVELPGPPPLEPVARHAARAWQEQRDAERNGRGDAWSASGSFRLTPHRPGRVVTLHAGAVVVEVDLDAVDGDPQPAIESLVDLERHLVAVNSAGATYTFSVPSRQQRWRPGAGEAAAPARALVAPFPGVVAEVRAVPGERVGDGQVLVVLEAMKMLHSLTAGGPGTIERVDVAAGDQVTSGAVLVTFEAEPGDEPGTPT